MTTDASQQPAPRDAGGERTASSNATTKSEPTLEELERLAKYELDTDVSGCWSGWWPW